MPDGMTQELNIPDQEGHLKMLVRNQKNRIDSLESRVAKLEGDYHKLWQ